MGLALFGDSIASGLGVRDATFGQIVAAELNQPLIDYSHTGWTIKASLEAFISEPSNPEFAIIAHGITEPIIRPRLDGVPLPGRWRRLGWMDPRAYYSSRLQRRLLERMESALRWRTKNVLIRLRGHYQLLSQEEYVEGMVALIEKLESAGTQVIIVAPSAIDQRYFPGSGTAQRSYLEAIRSEKSVQIVQPSLDEWGDFLLDHFHPNDNGHRRTALAILDALK